jgi:hypothetical protein
MPGDPKECRQRALACVRLAQTSASTVRHADDLERTQAFLDAPDDDAEPIRRTG